MKILYLIPLVILLSARSSYGQTSQIPDLSATERFFLQPDVAIARLTEAALARSASVEALRIDRDIIGEDLQIARKDIYKNLSLAGDYLYGNLGLLSISEGSQIGIGTGLASRYSAGFRLSLPLDMIISRPNRINRVQLQLKQAEFIQKSREEEISQFIINMYQDVVLARRTLKVHTEARESARINKQLSEKSFREGQVSLADMSVVTEAYTRAAIDYESSYTNYETAVRILEEIVGMNIIELMNP
ncbi:TolC family protein [Anditalea andensis]|nr:TolC family protein [Anditalea andensis]